MDRRLLVFLFFLLPALTIAQNNLTGRITDDQGKAIPFVQITCNEIGLKTATDENGQFDFFIPIGRKVKFKKKGYKEMTVAIATYKELNIRLIQKGKKLPAAKKSEHKNPYILKKDSSSYSFSSTITAENFNLGNIHHPLELIQGQVAGLMITRGGGNNPFGRFGVRMRGLSTINSYQNNNLEALQPHYIIDGMPAANLELLDPLMIQSFKIIKGAQAAQYGIRGSRGAIEISTTSAQKNGIQYHSYIALDRPVVNQEFLNAQSFINIGGANLGADTDWYEPITRSPISQAHQLSLTKQKGNTRLQAALNFRDAEGVLLHQGFNRLQANFYLEQKALNDKLTLGFQNRTSVQEDNYSQPLAFRYAQSSNPTLPVLDESSEFGGYGELVIFNQYNPVSMIEQSKNLGRNTQVFNRAFAKFQLLPSIQFNASYHAEQLNIKKQEYVNKTAFWRGRWYNGFASQTQSNTSNQFFDAHVNLKKRFEKFGVSLNIGHQYQLITDENFSVSTGDFLTDATTFNNLAISNDLPNGQASINSGKHKNKFAAFYATFNLNYDNILNIDGGWRMEGNSRLGANNKWGQFPFMTAELNTPAIFKAPFFQNHQIKIRTGIGLTGTPPHADFLSLQKYVPLGKMFLNGRFVPYYGEDIILPNPNLSWEKKSEYELGLSGQISINDKPLRIQLDGYHSYAKDLILTTQTNVQFKRVNTNAAELKSNGVELQLSYPIIANDKIEWLSSLSIARDRTKYFKHPLSDNSIDIEPRPGGATVDGCCKIRSSRFIEEDLIGIFWVPKAIGFDNDGRIIFEDVNGDGRSNGLDIAAKGNGLPDFSLSWNNQINYKQFSLNFRLWGAVGHQVFNVTKKWGSFPSIVNAYNILEATLNNEFSQNVEFPQELNLFVENASFIRLSNLNISYTIPTQKHFKNIRLYLSGQNLFTISTYDGWDPEVRMDSNGYQLSPGYEMRTEYLPTKSFVFGIQLGI